MARDAIARYRAVLERLQSRGRFGINLGLGRTRALLQRPGRPACWSCAGALIGGTNGKGSTQALVASASCARPATASARRPSRTSSATASGSVVDGEPISQVGLRRPGRGGARPCRRGRGAPRATDRVRGAHRGRVHLVPARAASTSPWSRSASAAGSTRPTSGRAAWRRSPTSRSTTWSTWATRSRRSRARRRGSSSAATSRRSPARTSRPVRSSAAAQRRSACRLEAREPFEVDRHGSHRHLRSHAAERELRIGLLGRHQAANAAWRCGILDASTSTGIDLRLSPSSSSAGFANARWPGRLELISRAGRRRTCCSTAPTTRTASRLWPRRSTSCCRDDQPVTLLIGRDRRAWPITGRRACSIRSSRVAVPGDRDRDDACPTRDRSTPAAELAVLGPGARRDRRHRTRALDDGAASARRQTDGIVVVCGSLYLVGHVRARLLGLEKRLDRPTTMDATPSVTLPPDARSGIPERPPQPITHRRPRVRVGHADVRDGHHQRHARLVQRRRPARHAAPIPSRPPWPRRGRWPPRAPTCSTSAANRRAPATTTVPTTDELRSASCPSSAPCARRCPTCRSASTRRAPPSPRRRSTPAPTLINDVWGVRPSDGLARLAAERGVPIVLMHNREEARYRNVVAEVVADLQRAIDRALAAGVPLGAAHRRPGHRLRQDGRAQPGRAARPGRCSALLGPADPARHEPQVDHRQGARPARRPAARGHAGDHRAGRRSRASTSSASTTSRPNVRVARMADAIVRGGWREPADGEPDDRPDRPAAAWSSRGATACRRRGARRAAGDRGRRRDVARPARGRHARRPGADRQLRRGVRDLPSAGRGAAATTCSRRSPRPSRPTSWPLSTASSRSPSRSGSRACRSTACSSTPECEIERSRS